MRPNLFLSSACMGEASTPTHIFYKELEILEEGVEALWPQQTLWHDRVNQHSSPIWISRNKSPELTFHILLAEMTEFSATFADTDLNHVVVQTSTPPSFFLALKYNFQQDKTGSRAEMLAWGHPVKRFPCVVGLDAELINNLVKPW